MHLTFGNAADEVVHALTHGPTPDLQEWEIEESCYDCHGATAIIRINGRSFEVRVTEIPEGE